MLLRSAAFCGVKVRLHTEACAIKGRVGIFALGRTQVVGWVNVFFRVASGFPLPYQFGGKDEPQRMINRFVCHLLDPDDTSAHAKASSIGTGALFAASLQRVLVARVPHHNASGTQCFAVEIGFIGLVDEIVDGINHKEMAIP